jgi:hypothetical protein
VSDDESQRWLMFLAQLPASPSSARVTLWRRLRAAGATGFMTGAWVLPERAQHSELFARLADTVRAEGGQAAVFTAQSLDGDDGAVVERFRADRAREYGEFEDRGQALLAEIEKERRLEKFTFAELEEIEDDLHKLTAWLVKIEARDFFPDGRREAARTTLAACAAAHGGFAEDVYAHEGLGAPDETNP